MSFTRLTPPIKLLLLTDSKRFDHNQAMFDVLEQALQGGVDTIVLREKHLDSAKLLALASNLRALTTKYSARFMVHSQADIAKAVHADGVHVDAASIPEISKIKQWLNNDMLISASCHNQNELQHAQDEGADFAFLSPVFPTLSHPGAPSLGAKQFLKISQEMDMPILALGGIDAQNKEELNGAGLATMGGILDAKDPKKAAESFMSPNATYPLLQVLQKIAPLGYYTYSVANNTWTCSQELDHIFGIDQHFKKDIAGWIQLIHPDYKQELLHYLQHDVLTQQKKFDKQYKIICINTGQEKWVHGLGELKLNRQNEPIEMFGIIQDITEQKHADELVRKLSQAVTAAGGSIIITNRKGIIEYVNPAFETMTGYSSDEAIGHTPQILKSGHQDNVFYKNLWRTISNGETWHGKIINKKKDGSLFPTILNISPITDEQGITTHFVGSHTNISALENMEKQFRQAQKMEALGTLVGGIAHDFNNMLAGITGNLYLMKKKLQDNPDTLHKVNTIEELSARAANMVRQLLTFARKDVMSIQPLSLTSFMKETLKFLLPSIPENILIQQNICSESLQINGDPTQLHQVLMNLLINARDALETVQSPRITITLNPYQIDDAFVASKPYFKVGTYAHLSIEDNGTGISESDITHVFEPFFTTKEQNKGTGLGLSMVFGAIKSHQGFIEVDSTEDKGTVFHVYLPLTHEPTPPSTATKNRMQRQDKAS